MAVYRNYYNRINYNKKWALTIPCLFLLCSTINHLVNGERIRPHLTPDHNQYLQQLEDSLVEKKVPPISSCPNCPNGNNRQIDSETDKLRLEAIKRQILSKLGLRHKPNVTYSLPKEIVMETLFRAEDSSDFFGKYDSDDEIMTSSARTATMETVDIDDFYGRTSEIISFAEQGSRVNQNSLLEFKVSPEIGQAEQEFHIRTATLWLKADIRQRRPPRCRSTEIYVFKIISSLPQAISLSSQEFDRVATDPVTLSLEESKSGWQKLDITETVKTWLTESRREKLRLFVDCSCCSHWHIHIFNNEVDKRSNPSRPFLVIHTDPNTAKRVRRRAIDCSVSTGNQCCKQRFYVSFKQLGWEDWVIAPQGYYANYCRGDCGHHRTPDTYVTYHTHVMEEVRKSRHLSGMQPCCAPLKFSSMSLIYYGPDLNIIKRDLPKMVVDECGCP